MPYKFAKPCAKPGCNQLTHGRYCERHVGELKRNTNAKPRPSAAKRGYDREWQGVRAAILKRDAICKICKTARSTCVDHKIPLRSGGTHSHYNLQGLCAPCHSHKTATEDGGGWTTVNKNRTPSPNENKKRNAAF